MREQFETLARECDTGDQTALSHRWVASEIRKILRKHSQESEANGPPLNAEEGEPVAWRMKNDFGHWYVTSDPAKAHVYRDIEKLDVEPLYAHPKPSPATGERTEASLKDAFEQHSMAFAVKYGPFTNTALADMHICEARELYEEAEIPFSLSATGLVEALEKAHEHLGGVSSPVMNGDNLAITICTLFDDPDAEDTDDTGWSEAARFGCKQVLDAIHAHYVAALSSFKTVDGDLCRKDGAPCFAGAGTDDARWRCGTVQCGNAPAPSNPRPVSQEEGNHD